MDSLILKFTNKYICSYGSFEVRGVWNKEELLKGDVVKKDKEPSGL